MRPPSPGLLTTLLVTDIERSTELWETLPGDVMQRAMQLHHNVLRDKLQNYKGYETATEVGPGGLLQGVRPSVEAMG